MSDYIYILESHLSPDQNRAVAEVHAAAVEANVNLFLTGGAMRDMLAGFRIRDLDFVVEGNALKLAKALADRSGAKIVSSDENRKSAELVFPGLVTAQVAMSRLEKQGRAGSKPQVTQATVQEDLRGRDFTCNAIALSLTKASRGLLLDPMNGLADLGRRELRAISGYGFYDDPSRLLRLVRLAVRLGFAIEERTQMQVANAREAHVEDGIPARALGEELRRISAEDVPSEILKSLEETGLIARFSPALTGPKLNLAGMARYEKQAELLPDEPAARAARLGPFLYVLTEKLSPKERQVLVKNCELTKADVDAWQKLDVRAKKLETAVRSARIRKPSQVYRLVAPAPLDLVLHLLYRSGLKPVQDRLRAYFQKYLPALQEITPEEWEAMPVKPGNPRYAKARLDFISERLDRKPPKPPPPPEEGVGGPGEPPPPPVVETAGMRRVR